MPVQLVTSHSLLVTSSFPLMSEITNQVSDQQPPVSELRSPNRSASRLPAPVRITDQSWPEGTVPVVSVFCITYNHVNFIRDAIEGFLMQETTFPVEIFIHDDASTDGTAEIVKEYAEKYPNLFWAVLQTENQWSKGNKKILTDYLQKQRGEFIALCEADDYWTCKEKLQMQVYYLEINEKYSACFHTVYRDDGSDFKPVIPGPKKARHIYFEDLCKEAIFNTCTILYRRVITARIELFLAKCKVGDWPLFLYLANQGPIACIPKPMGVYRFHQNGVYSGATVPRKCELKISVLEAAIAQFSRDISILKIFLKKTYLDKSLAEIDEKKRWVALKSFAKFFFADPARFSLPANMKRNVAKIFLPVFLWSMLVKNSKSTL